MDEYYAPEVNSVAPQVQLEVPGPKTVSVLCPHREYGPARRGEFICLTLIDSSLVSPLPVAPFAAS